MPVVSIVLCIHSGSDCNSSGSDDDSAVQAVVSVVVILVEAVLVGSVRAK
jgi:hypothetical protein